jgi:hypothetical protein
LKLEPLGNACFEGWNADPMKEEYDFSDAERGKSLRKSVRLVPRVTAQKSLDAADANPARRISA